jgi:hypothetical protein
MPTLLVDGVSIEVSPEVAAVLADELWQGRWPGSATSAAKLTAALRRPEDAAQHPIVFEAYESRAIHAALESNGILAPSDSAQAEEE